MKRETNKLTTVCMVTMTIEMTVVATMEIAYVVREKLRDLKEKQRIEEQRIIDEKQQSEHEEERRIEREWNKKYTEKGIPRISSYSKEELREFMAEHNYDESDVYEISRNEF